MSNGMIKVDLVSVNNKRYVELMAKAVKLGIVDATGDTPEKTGKEIAKYLGIYHYRNGHLTYLRYAYMSGRFQVDNMGVD